MVDRAATIEVLAGFRQRFYQCMTRRADALFELADALLCADGPVKTLVGLTLVPEHRRGHGAMYDALNQGRIDVAALRRELAGLPLPRAANVQVTDARYVLARIRVMERVKGPAGDVVVLAQAGTPWRVGQRLLVFLKVDSGPSAEVRPRHLRVTDEHGGWYVMRGDAVVGADFTLADVQKLAGP